MKQSSVYSLDKLKVGQVIDCKEIQKKDKRTRRSISATGDIVYNSIEVLVPENPKQFKGVITKIENAEITIKMPNGTEEVIEWINFIIWVLPKLKAIFFLIKSLFTKKETNSIKKLDESKVQSLGEIQKGHTIKASKNQVLHPDPQFLATEEIMYEGVVLDIHRISRAIRLMTHDGNTHVIKFDEFNVYIIK